MGNLFKEREETRVLKARDTSSANFWTVLKQNNCCLTVKTLKKKRFNFTWADTLIDENVLKGAI